MLFFSLNKLISMAWWKLEIEDLIWPLLNITEELSLCEPNLCLAGGIQGSFASFTETASRVQRTCMIRKWSLQCTQNHPRPIRSGIVFVGWVLRHILKWLIKFWWMTKPRNRIRTRAGDGRRQNQNFRRFLRSQIVSHFSLQFQSLVAYCQA
jgi:hypothetical protein